MKFTFDRFYFLKTFTFTIIVLYKRLIIVNVFLYLRTHCLKGHIIYWS